MSIALQQTVTVEGKTGTVTDTTSEVGYAQVTFKDGTRRYIANSVLEKISSSPGKLALMAYALTQYHALLAKIQSGAVLTEDDINALKWPISS